MDSDYGDSDEDAFLLAATQAENSQSIFTQSPRPAKRRRVGSQSHRTTAHVNPAGLSVAAVSSSLPRADVSSESDSDLRLDSNVGSQTEAPTSNEADAENDKISKRKIHHPEVRTDFRDEFRTQFEPIATQPYMIRGAIWQKPAKSPVAVSDPQVHPRSVEKTPVSRLQPWGHSSADKENATPTGNNIVRASAISKRVVDVQKELDDLPSDAFDSSSPGGLNSRLVAPLNNLRQTTLFGHRSSSTPASQVGLKRNYRADLPPEPPTHHKLEHNAIRTWTYPINLGTIREYQYNIVHKCLFNNTLVALPTGLGKTFIAATVMLNWFRWTTDAQIVFTAPTKPLVAQQVEACFNITGIPHSQTTMLTGGVSPALRAEEWQSKRVFFMTPQTLINDLKSGYCDPKRLVLLVIDEAHRATGSYAYVEVVKFLDRFNQSVRILALTATPGSTVDSVQEVIDGCNISKVEIRTEQSMDIRRYVHNRKIEKEVFANSEEMQMFMDLYSNAVSPLLTVLNSQNAYWSKDALSLTLWGLQQAKRQWYAGNAGRHAEGAVKNMVNTIFAILSSLAHAMELLKYHGTLPFFHSMQSFQAELLEGKSKSKYRRQIHDHKDFGTLMMRLKRCHADPDYIGHPKLERLQAIVMNHFMDSEEGTRVMVFAHYRDSAEDIARVLNRHAPIIKASVFVGQAASKNMEGMNQKKQQEIIAKFKAGTINTLIATSIGEEGLDIGEVDLIICYDSKASPIRMLQRMGRTGRKREGKIVLFQMKGKEENDAAKAKDNYERIQELIADGGQFTFHDSKSRRILPKDVVPEVDKTVVEIPAENSQGTQLPVPSRRKKPLKKPSKKFHMPDGVTTGFVTAAGGSLNAQRRNKQQLSDLVPEVIVEEVYTMPNCSEVALSESQDADWERRYLHTGDEEELTITIPRLDAFPALQRKARRKHYVSNTDRSLSLGKLYNARVRTDRRPEFSSDVYRHGGQVLTSSMNGSSNLTHQNIARTATAKQSKRNRSGGTSRYAVEASEADEDVDSSPPKTSQAMALPSQGIWLGSNDAQFEGTAPPEELPDSELADFVVDDDASIQLDEDDDLDSVAESEDVLPNLSQIQRADSRKRQCTRKAAACLNADESDDSGGDLPAVGDLFNRNQVKLQKAAQPVSDTESDVPVRRTVRSRRIVSDSSDEE